MKKAKCPVCGKHFEIKRPWQRFDSKECRNKFHVTEMTRALKAFRTQGN